VARSFSSTFLSSRASLLALAKTVRVELARKKEILAAIQDVENWPDKEEVRRATVLDELDAETKVLNQRLMALYTAHDIAIAPDEPDDDDWEAS